MSEQLLRNENVAKWLRRGADSLCLGRIVSAPILAGYILATPDYRSPKLASLIAGLYMTDKVDGIMARKAANILGEETTRASAELDQKADKILTTSLFASIVTREYLNGNNSYAKSLAVNLTIDGLRNIIVNRSRRNAPEGVDIAAQEAGKYKQMCFVLGVISATIPITIPHQEITDQLDPGESLVLDIVDCATTLSVVSGAQLIQSIHQQTADLLGYTPTLAMDSLHDTKDLIGTIVNISS